ncbi:MAG: hypothetical protein IT204_10780 [Fimbriimonadaceae bacterium]|nr:hypothetical protein [Fimbriimonadaceae bacterium]
MADALADGIPLTAQLVGDAYRGPARGPLCAAQHHKCCYCERALEEKFQEVDHFRPKAAARQGAGIAPQPGYWWLAWSWENLLFACDCCNNAKRDSFPLADPQQRLAVGSPPPGREQPRLLDPAADDPMDHIQYVLVDRWLPLPRAGSQRGRTTIEIVKLWRQDLLELQNKQMELLEGPLQVALQALSSGTVTPQHWAAVAAFAQSSAQYAALAYEVIDAHIPAGVRQQYGLHLPRP